MACVWNSFARFNVPAEAEIARILVVQRMGDHTRIELLVQAFGELKPIKADLIRDARSVRHKQRRAVQAIADRFTARA